MRFFIKKELNEYYCKDMIKNCKLAQETSSVIQKETKWDTECQ